MYHSEQIEAYLRNELSGEEKKIFEEMLRRDPLLKNEFVLQQDTVQAIQAYRTQSLKARLNQLPTDTAAVSGTAYVAAGIAVCSLLLIGTAWFYNKPEETQPIIQKEARVQTPAKVNPQISEEIKPQEIQKPMNTEAKKTITTPKNHMPNVEIGKADEQIAVVLDETVDKATDENNINKDADNSNVPSGEVTPSAKTERQSVKVSVINDRKKYGFHYTFTEGKLFLYGDFNQVYEILDFETQAGKEVYLYYGNAYHLIKNQINISPLTKVNDPKLIQKLDDARKGDK
jgi:hypothetical protein